MHMKMILVIGGKEIDAMPLPFYTALNSPYITKVKELLSEKNEEIIDLSQEEPEYVIDGVPSRINFFEVIEKATAKKKVID